MKRVPMILSLSILFLAAAAPVMAVETAEPVTVAVQIKALNAKAKTLFDENFKGAYASYFTNGVAAAAEVYQEILALPDCPNADKIAAWQGLANCYLEMFQVAEANAAIDAALALPNLTEEERFTAQRNKADTIYRQLEYEKALSLYDALWSEKVQIHAKRHIEKRIVDILLKLGRTDEARRRLDVWKSDPLTIAAFYLETDQAAKARETYTTMLITEGATFKERSAAIEKLLLTYAAEGNAKTLIAEAERHIGKMIQEDEKGGWALYSRLASRSFQSIADNPNYVRWLGHKLLSAPHLTDANFLTSGETLFNFYLKNRELIEAKNLAEQLLARSTSDELRQKHGLNLIVLNSGGKAAGVQKKIEALLAGLETAKKDSPALASAFQHAALTAMTARYEDLARTLDAARDKLLVSLESRTIPCTFVQNGPKDISSFLSSAIFRDVRNRALLDRKYGDNLKFLIETDAALTDRKVTAADAAEAFQPTAFVATCDEDAVRLFFLAPVAPEKLKAITDGFTKLAGYEMYLASGPDAPYHCFLVSQSSARKMFEGFNTQYDNANFRRAREETGMVEIDHRVVDNGVAMLISISWQTFFNALPASGDAWPFESIHWDKGGYSWGGSQSVHNRSSFGSLIFANLTEANLRSIKRRLIPAAAAVYRAEVSARNNGCVEIWQDPELGDQKFYNEDLAPLKAKLDDYLTLAKPEMDDATIDKLFAEAVPSWMNIAYIVSDLRRDALDRRRLRGE